MGFEDEVEQSFARPCRQTKGRSKRINELTSSIVPQGTSFHRSAELEFSPIAFDPARLSCRCNFPGPPELGAVNPYTVHDHGQPTRRATIAFFSPRCLAIFIAQALSQDHLIVRVSMTWAASNSTVRIMASPHFEMLPIRSISPD